MDDESTGADLKARLEAERAQLADEIRELDDMIAIEGAGHTDEHGGYGNHMADDATETYEQEQYVALRRNADTLLQQVDRALRKFEQGTYGRCERCGRQIDPERLQALPYASYCISCQAAEEAARVG